MHRFFHSHKKKPQFGNTEPLTQVFQYNSAFMFKHKQKRPAEGKGNFIGWRAHNNDNLETMCNVSEDERNENQLAEDFIVNCIQDVIQLKIY